MVSVRICSEKLACVLTVQSPMVTFCTICINNEELSILYSWVYYDSQFDMDCSLTQDLPIDTYDGEMYFLKGCVVN